MGSRVLEVVDSSDYCLAQRTHVHMKCLDVRIGIQNCLDDFRDRDLIQHAKAEIRHDDNAQFIVFHHYTVRVSLHVGRKVQKRLCTCPHKATIFLYIYIYIYKWLQRQLSEFLDRLES